MIKSFLLTVIIGAGIIGGTYLTLNPGRVVYTMSPTERCYYDGGGFLRGTTKTCECRPERIVPTKN